MLITGIQVKGLVNDLIDMQAKNAVGYSESELRMRNQGIQLAIIHMNSMFLGEVFRPANERHELEHALLKEAV